MGCSFLVQLRRRRSCIVRLATDTGGTTALEFGLLCAPLLGFITGILMLGLQLLTGSVLDEMVLESARQLQIGNLRQPTGSTGAPDQLVRNLICGGLGGLASNCNTQLKIYVASGVSFSTLLPVPSPSPTGFNPGAFNTDTIVVATYVSSFTSSLANLPGIALSSTAVYRSTH